VSSTVIDHVCLGYRQSAEFVTAARRFLTTALAGGEQILYVGSGDETALAEQLRSAGGRFDEGLRSGAVQVASVDSTYCAGAVVDPAGQVAFYAAATEQALAAGFSGLRVAADATGLVRTPAQLDAFARYEHLVDHYMAAHPMTAMCGYDLGELGEEAVAQLACMHPRAEEVASPFHLHGHVRVEAAAALGGELDMESRRWWPLALEREDLQADTGTIAIDAVGLDFVDHHGMLAVADYAERHATTVVLRTRLSAPARLLDLLDLTSVRVERG
jgi:ABC-type transporter Mla MlaB component